MLSKACGPLDYHFNSLFIRIMLYQQLDLVDIAEKHYTNSQHFSNIYWQLCISTSNTLPLELEDWFKSKFCGSQQVTNKSAEAVTNHNRYVMHCNVHKHFC